MLMVKEFKRWLIRLNGADWLHVSMGLGGTTQFYIVGNDDMETTISKPFDKTGIANSLFITVEGD